MIQAGILFCCLLVASSAALAQAPRLNDANPTSPPPRAGSKGLAQPVVLDIVLHDREDIMKMLSRAEKLAMTPNPSERPESISLVLHGPEIEHFQISHYTTNRDIVDLAAKLDAFNIIDVKMCNTRMSMMGIEKKDVPAFIEIVPYGPAEVERLQSMGFIKL
jgi:intracellular sulfur oxidation DsrE/DsrF family protein